MKWLLLFTSLLAGISTSAKAEEVPMYRVIVSGIFCDELYQLIRVIKEAPRNGNLQEVIDSPVGDGCGFVQRPTHAMIKPLVDYKTPTHILSLVEFYLPKYKVKQYGWSKMVLIKGHGI